MDAQILTLLSFLGKAVLGLKTPFLKLMVLWAVSAPEDSLVSEPWASREDVIEEIRLIGVKNEWWGPNDKMSLPGEQSPEVNVCMARQYYKHYKNAPRIHESLVFGVGWTPGQCVDNYITSSRVHAYCLRQAEIDGRNRTEWMLRAWHMEKVVQVWGRLEAAVDSKRAITSRRDALMDLKVALGDDWWTGTLPLADPYGISAYIRPEVRGK